MGLALAEADDSGPEAPDSEGMEVSYTAKAALGDVTGSPKPTGQWTSGDPDLPVRVRGQLADGTVVIEGVIRLWVTPRK